MLKICTKQGSDPLRDGTRVSGTFRKGLVEVSSSGLIQYLQEGTVVSFVDFTSPCPDPPVIAVVKISEPTDIQLNEGIGIHIHSKTGFVFSVFPVPEPALEVSLQPAAVT